MNIINKINLYKLGYARFDWFRNSRYETIFTSETVDNNTKAKWRTETSISDQNIDIEFEHFAIKVRDIKDFKDILCFTLFTAFCS